MKNKPDISIIIPIYNTEKYLDKCLHSIIHQTMQEIEIICIDDCSPDNSKAIVRKWINNDSRITLIQHKENTGQGGARNTGILAAKADYILCVDSDDALQSNMLEKLWDASDSGKHDAVICGFTSINECGKVISNHALYDHSYTNFNHEFDIFSLNTAPWNKLWKKNLFVDNNIWFPNHMHFQDLATIPLLLSKARKINIIKNELYLYLVRENSVTTTFTPRHIIDYFKVFEVILNYFKEQNLLRLYHKKIISMISSHLHFHAKNVVKSKMSRHEVITYLELLLLLKLGFYQNHSFLIEQERGSLLGMLKDHNLFDSLKVESGK